MPRSLRFMTDEFTESQKEPPSRQGLDALRCSASAEASKGGFSLLYEKIRERAGADAPIYLVDLRQESHGFVNGDIPVSWHVDRNWGNYGNGATTVQKAEQMRLAALVGTTATFLPMGNADTKILSPITEKVVSAEPEEAIARKLGFRYVRIAATDQASPSDESIDAFLAFVSTLPPDAWLHFHCHAGHGRTTTFMAFYDILRNPDLPLETIVARQHALGGTNLFAAGNKDNWRGQETSKRADQVRKFYAYVQATRGKDAPVPFSEWAGQKRRQRQK